VNPSRYREHLVGRLVASNVPEHLYEGLVEYLAARRPVGGFLTAVLSNDLTTACVRADQLVAPHIRDVVLFLVNYAPANAWGNETHVSNWLNEQNPAPELYE
jgi:hypothetical protein